MAICAKSITPKGTEQKKRSPPPPLSTFFSTAPNSSELTFPKSFLASDSNSLTHSGWVVGRWVPTVSSSATAALGAMPAAESKNLFLLNWRQAEPKKSSQQINLKYACCQTYLPNAQKNRNDHRQADETKQTDSMQIGWNKRSSAEMQSEALRGPTACKNWKPQLWLKLSKEFCINKDLKKLAIRCLHLERCAITHASGKVGCKQPIWGPGLQEPTWGRQRLNCFLAGF